MLLAFSYWSPGVSFAEEDLTEHFYFRDVAITCSLMNSATSPSGKEGLQLLCASAPDPVRRQDNAPPPLKNFYSIFVHYFS